MQNMCTTAAASYEYSSITTAVGFHCNLIGREVTLRGVRRAAADASDSGRARRVWAW